MYMYLWGHIPYACTCVVVEICGSLICLFTVFSVQDLERLYPKEMNVVRVTLVEANTILSAFDNRLRSYTEKIIQKRKRMRILKASVTGMHHCTHPVVLVGEVVCTCMLKYTIVRFGVRGTVCYPYSVCVR